MSPFIPPVRLLGCLPCSNNQAMEVDYHPGLVLLSIVIALVSSYTALDLAERVAASTGLTRRVLLGSGALMQGIAIWSMHFVGMLAAQMPMQMSYDPGLTALSMGTAILGSWAALFLVSRTLVTPQRLLAGGLFIGLAITAMHYIGMAAMRMEARPRYEPGLFTLSVLIAIGAGWGSLWMAFRLQRQPDARAWMKLGSSLLMGAAIAGMHYTGMAAVRFIPARIPPESIDAGIQISGLGAVAIGAATLGGLGLTLLTSLVDLEQRRTLHTLKLLADASAVLGRSLDTPTLANTLAELVAPALAEGCVVDLLQEEGASMRRIAVRYPRDRQREERYQGISYPVDPSSDHPLQQVVRTREPVSLPLVSRGELESLARAPERLTLPLDTRAGAVLIVPLVHRERVLGVITVFTRERPLGLTEHLLVQELGRRAGSAVENAQLYRQAQDAIRVRDEFLSIASHELNTPLTPLKLNLQRLQRTVIGVEQQQMSFEQMAHVVDVAQRQTRRLARLVNELLDISRIRLGRMELQLEELELVEVVHEAMVRSQGELVWTEGEPRFHPKGPVVGWWDRRRLSQVTLNLLHNAVRYGQGKPVDVVVCAQGDEAVLVVKDRGIGIAPEACKCIFERFERAASHNFGGLGLGLYIVREIVEAHGGTIQVESQLGLGSTFTVRLPLRQAH